MINGFGIEYKGNLLSENIGFKKTQNSRKLKNKNGSIKTIDIYVSDANDLEIRNVIVEYPNSSIIEKWVEIKNISANEIKITRVDSINGLLPSGEYKLRYFNSQAGGEFCPVDIPLQGTKVLEVTSGRSSNGMNPWFCIEGMDGSILSCAIAWSGNWIVRFEPQTDGRYKISGGLSNWDFFKILKPGETMEGIHMIYTFLPEGDFDRSCIEFGRWGRKFLYPKNPISEGMIVTWNHWWPYEDVEINEDVFKENIDMCHSIGADISILDAGWFGEPDKNCNSNKAGWSENVDWYLKRGDWHKVNIIRFPSGIRALSDYAHSKGLKFGIWCEIEAVGKKADIAMMHPEYIAQRDGKPLGYMCMGNPGTVKWAFSVVEKLINDYGADWIKFDFNLNPGAGCNRTDHGHGEGDGLYEHYRGYYRLLSMIREKYPNVFIENCSSGGLRVDLGIMKYVHASFLSDPDNTVHHLQTFWGQSVMLHPSVCYHFTWSQNRVFYESNIDKDPIKDDMKQSKLDYIVRADMLDMLGYSYRLPELPKWCAERISYHSKLYKEVIGRFIKEADMYHLTGQALDSGRGDKWNSFLYVMENKEEAVMFVFRLPCGENERKIVLKGLIDDAVYKVRFEDRGICYKISGEDLMKNGILFTDMEEESSEIIYINKVN